MKLNVLTEDKRHLVVNDASRIAPRMTTNGKNPRFGIIDVYSKLDNGEEVMIASFSEVSSWWIEK